MFFTTIFCYLSRQTKTVSGKNQYQTYKENGQNNEDKNVIHENHRLLKITEDPQVRNILSIWKK